MKKLAKNVKNRGKKVLKLDGQKSSTAQTRDGQPLKGRKYKTREIITTTLTNK
jgi:hypothetical protein